MPLLQAPDEAERAQLLVEREAVPGFDLQGGRAQGKREVEIPSSLDSRKWRTLAWIPPPAAAIS
jgi:hypothetical protein